MRLHGGAAMFYGAAGLGHTLRLRQDLQFIDSRGSLVRRRAGSLSIPTCGRDMAMGCALRGRKGATGGCSTTETDMPEVMRTVYRTTSASVREVPR